MYAYLRQIKSRFWIQGLYPVLAHISAVEIDRQIWLREGKHVAIMRIPLPFQGSRAFLESTGNGSWVVMIIDKVENLKKSNLVY